MNARTLLRGRSAVMLGSAVACVVETLPGVPGAVLTAAGLWLLIGAPVALWRGTAAKAVSTRDAALMVAVGLAVVTDLLVALAVNTLLPPFGIDEPLTRANLAGASAMVVAVLGAFLPEAPPPARRFGLPAGTATLAGLGALTLVLSVAGPIRLNNGLSGTVSTIALVAVAALLLLLMVRRRRYPVPLLEGGLYVAAAALLLLNSLRGWGIAGHDIQREYEYFRLALGGSYWNVELYPDAYNACLSITLLPVSVARLTAIPGIYVFKVVLPLLFALTPVLVHRAVRNVAPQFVALLSAVYFMLFPTFFTDMTFLGRQEIAFLLLGCAMAVLTDTGRPMRARRVAVLALLVGCVLSHYSTTYVVVATLAVGYAVELLWRLAASRGRTRLRRRSRVAGTGTLITWWLVLVPAVLAVVWAGPVTHTSVQLKSTLGIVVQEVLHPGQGKGGSSDTAYSLFGGAKAGPQQRLDEFRAETVAATDAKRAVGDYFPLQAVEGYRTVAVPQADMPLTPLGRALDTAGLSVTGLNGALRQGAALMLQVLVLVGFAAVLRARRRSFRPLRDQVTLTVGALAMVALFTLLPQLSVDYSVLRAFQQGLFFYAPFLAAGTLWLLRWAGRRTVPVACALTLALFLDLTGVVPKLLGGYPAQLQLSNAGRSFDIYYPHVEEQMAVYWLEKQIATDKRQVLQTDRYTFSRLQTLITGPAQADVQPVVIRPNSYVLLGATTVRKGEVTVFYRGDLVTYKYPTALLSTTKNRIYSSEGAVIYR